MSLFEAVGAYDRFMGRYSEQLAPALAGVAGITAGASVLDVGCGTGISTAALAELAGSERVAGVDPSERFVAAACRRVPGADIRVGTAEQLPFEDDSFDATVSQLVFAFVDDPDGAVREMRRVTRRGGVLAACMWDVSGEMTLLRVFWETAKAVARQEAERYDETTKRRFTREGELGDLWRRSGLDDVRDGALVVSAAYSNFDDLWDPLEGGVGPAGSFVASLDAETRRALRQELRLRLDVDDGPFELSARAWYAAGKA